VTAAQHSLAHVALGLEVVLGAQWANTVTDGRLFTGASRVPGGVEARGEGARRCKQQQDAAGCWKEDLCKTRPAGAVNRSSRQQLWHHISATGDSLPVVPDMTSPPPPPQLSPNSTPTCRRSRTAWACCRGSWRQPLSTLLGAHRALQGVCRWTLWVSWRCLGRRWCFHHTLPVSRRGQMVACDEWQVVWGWEEGGGQGGRAAACGKSAYRRLCCGSTIACLNLRAASTRPSSCKTSLK
jgi:hypothetical protein